MIKYSISLSDNILIGSLSSSSGCKTIIGTMRVGSFTTGGEGGLTEGAEEADKVNAVDKTGADCLFFFLRFATKLNADLVGDVVGSDADLLLLPRPRSRQYRRVDVKLDLLFVSREEAWLWFALV